MLVNCKIISLNVPNDASILHPLFKICTAWYHPILFSGAPHPTNTTDTFAILFELTWRAAGVRCMSIVRMSGGGSLNPRPSVNRFSENLAKDIRSAINYRPKTPNFLIRYISAVAVAIIIKITVNHHFLICLCSHNNRKIHKTYINNWEIENACLLWYNTIQYNTIQYNTIVIMNQICIIFAIVIVLFTDSITAWTPIVTSFQRLRTTSLLSKAGSVSKLYNLYLYFMSRILIKIIQHRNIQDFKIVMIPMMIA